MVEVELDPFDKNKEGALKIREAPFWRYGFMLAVAALWLASLPLIVNQAETPLVATLLAMGVLAAIALVVWYLLANRVSGFHSAGLSQIALSRGTTYRYEIQDGLVHRHSDEGSKSWSPPQFVGSEINQGYAILIFKTAVCYLPFHGASRQQVVNFVQEVELLARNQ